MVREHLQTFLWELDRHHDERGTPLFVKREFQRFVRCGVLAYGFARFRCTEPPGPVLKVDMFYDIRGLKELGRARAAC